MQIPAPNAFSSFFCEADETNEASEKPFQEGESRILFPAESFAIHPVLRTEKIERKYCSLALCPITGIVLTIGIPELPFPLTYENPIAKSRNALKIANLSEKRSLPNDILAGTILSLLSAMSLIGDNLPSQQRNSLLASLSKEILCEALSGIAKILAKEKNQFRNLSEDVPSFSCRNASSLPLVIKEWLSYFFPEPEEKQQKEKPILASEKTITVRQRTASIEQIKIRTRLQIQQLCKDLSEEGIISKTAAEKISGFVTTNAKMSKLQKQQFLAYLEEKQCFHLKNLVETLPVIVSKAEIEDEILPSETLAQPRETKTAAEMLAEWKAKRNGS